jgi:sigma-E factor negative regulatory protein RseC
MNESEAIVRRLDGDHAWLDLRSACDACGESGGCGLSDGKGKPLQRLRNDVGARVGDTVILSVPDGIVLKAVIYCYLLPLSLVIGLAASGMAFAEEAGAIVGAGLGLLSGWIILRRSGIRLARPTMRLKTGIVQLHRKIQP